MLIQQVLVSYLFYIQECVHVNTVGPCQLPVLYTGVCTC